MQTDTVVAQGRLHSGRPVVDTDLLYVVCAYTYLNIWTFPFLCMRVDAEI